MDQNIQPNRDDNSQYISFRQLALKALPEMWTFQFFAALWITIPATLIRQCMDLVINSSGTALTTANAGELLLSWRGPVLIILSSFLVFWYIIAEILAHIYLCDDILRGRKTGVFRELKRAVQAIPRFFTAHGALIMLYILIAVPLVGFGWAISLTRSFYIPHFITDVIDATPAYSIAYNLVLILLAWFGFRSIFCVHGILIDHLDPLEARRESVVTIKAHMWYFLRSVLSVVLLLQLIQLAADLLLNVIPGFMIEDYGADLPHNMVINLLADNKPVHQLLGEIEEKVLLYRFLSSFFIMFGAYLRSLITLLSSSYFMLWFTRKYYELTDRPSEQWLDRPMRADTNWMAVLMVLVTVLNLFGSIAIGLFYNQIFDRESPPVIVAHRTGGDLASENSVDGLEASIAHHCYAGETDVQRTSDNHYIINHDDNFRRLTGVNKKPADMTLEEISKLRIRDTTGMGNDQHVPTLEELLLASKGRIKLFIELKGATADRQMVDDVVRIVREMDCVDDVALISLKYNVINYAETNYPEFETGTLFFAGAGDITKLNCDMLIMEEEMCSPIRIFSTQNAGKKVFVWTVNSEDGMYKFLGSDVDGIITDKIEMAEDVQKKLSERTEYEVLTDALESIWKG